VVLPSDRTNGVFEATTDFIGVAIEGQVLQAMPGARGRVLENQVQPCTSTSGAYSRDTHEVIFGLDGAGHAGAGLHRVFAHAQAGVLELAHERGAEHRVRGAFFHGLPDAGAEIGEALQSRAAVAATEKVFLDRLVSDASHFAQPVGGQRGLRNGTRRRACS
jgi:hypothetical protein